MNAENKVTKSNALVMACYNTSLEEFRIARTLISLVQPKDEDFKPYIFRIADFMELIGVKDKSKYVIIPKITENLMRRIIKIREGKRLLQVAWLSSALHDEGTGTVTLTFDPNLKPYLLDLNQNFVTYHLENIIKLKGIYSGRLYEILKSQAYKQTYEINIIDIKEIFQLGKSYSDFHEIRRRILEPAKKELAEKTDIMFDYEEIKCRNKVVSLKFHIRPNPKYEKSTPLVLPESHKLLEHPNIDDECKNEEDIEDIKRRFQHNYKGELVDKFVREMIEKKGSKHVYQCLTEFRGYIDGQDIRNVAGLFYKFVIDGLVKPVAHKGNVPQRDNFEQREYPDEFYESCYTNFVDLGIAPVRKK